jgi:CheY-like chemotaxis protein
MKEPILLVDDDEDDLAYVRLVLEPLGRELVTAADGEEALRCLRGRDFALIVMDVMMPRLNGFETAVCIREREQTRGIPIVFLTGFDAADVQALPGYAPVEAEFLGKPVRPDELIAKVADCLARRENATAP